VKINQISLQYLIHLSNEIQSYIFLKSKKNILMKHLISLTKNKLVFISVLIMQISK